MLSVINSISELYKTRMTGEIVVDNVVSVLRRTRAIFPEDVAAELNVDLKELRHAWHLLTKTKLRDAILEWRVCQAREMIEAYKATVNPTGSMGKQELRRQLAQKYEEVARACGWRSALVMKHAMAKF